MAPQLITLLEKDLLRLFQQQVLGVLFPQIGEMPWPQKPTEHYGYGAGMLTDNLGITQPPLVLFPAKYPEVELTGRMLLLFDFLVPLSKPTEHYGRGEKITQDN
jgi:hypothetical protein